MRPLTGTEYGVVCTLITDIEDGIAQIGRVLGADAPEVQEIKGARDWLRGIRDTGMLVYEGGGGEAGPGADQTH